MIHVFTAQIGDETDTLRDPSVFSPRARYVCATTRPLTGLKWEPHAVRVDAGDDAVTVARRFKIALHEHVPDGDVYVWMDAAYRLDVLPDLFETLLEAPSEMLVLRHPFCETLAKEADACAVNNLAPRDVLEAQAASYARQGFPMRSAHSSTGLLVRRRTRRIDAFNQFWLSEFDRHGHRRDQMSFDFCAWKLGIRVSFMRGHYQDNPYATWTKEKKAKKAKTT